MNNTRNSIQDNNSTQRAMENKSAVSILNEVYEQLGRISSTLQCLDARMRHREGDSDCAYEIRKVDEAYTVLILNKLLRRAFLYDQGDLT
ncbi:MAG: hypothetical protein KBS89_07540 [Bacteroidales bacterium]|nr:hypothetical protein [Candidatus Egerieousia equi]